MNFVAWDQEILYGRMKLLENSGVELWERGPNNQLPDRDILIKPFYVKVIISQHDTLIQNPVAPEELR